MRFVILFAGLLVCVAAHAVDQPQNPAEFKAAVSKGAAFVKMHSYVAKRGFADAAKMLEQKSEECLNFRRTTTTRDMAQSGRVTASRAADYTTTFRREDKKHAELTVQQYPRGNRYGPKMPEGGFYLVVVDIDADGPGATKLTFYGPSRGWDSTYDAIKRWSEGEAVACPSR